MSGWDEERIARERAICDAATEAPWLQRQPFVLFKPNQPTPDVWLATFDSPHDATFAAHARTALPEALDEIERLRGVIERYLASLRSGEFECPICRKSLHLRSIHIPSTPNGPEEWDVELDGECLSEPDEDHRDYDWILEHVMDEATGRSLTRERFEAFLNGGAP